MTRRVAVVLFNLGGPDSLDAVQPFLFNLFNDRAIIGLPQPWRWMVAKLISTLRGKTAREIYAHMGGRSPLLDETQAQAQALGKALSIQIAGSDFRVFIAMRYWRPFTAQAAEAVAAYQPDDVVLLPLYPHYSTTTTGSSLTAWKAAYRGSGQIHTVCCYPDAAGLIDAHVAKIQATLGEASLSSLRVLFSAHGLPQKVIAAGDPYQTQIERTAATIAERLALSDWRVCYQSRVGPMAWIGPSTIEAVQDAGRDRVGVLVVPIAFVSEHSETLVELDRDYRDLALSLDVPLYLRAPALGVEPSFVESLSHMALSALTKHHVEPGAEGCRSRFPQCPFQRAAA